MCRLDSGQPAGSLTNGVGPRIALVDEVPDDPVVAEVFARFALEDRAPIALYRALAHSPAVLRAYGTLATGLRYEASVDRDLRELVILRIALLMGSDYEWAHHRPMAVNSGLSEEHVACLHEWTTTGVFDERQRAALALADEVHLSAVTDHTFERVRGLLGDSHTVELLVVAAFYEAVARIVQGLGVEVEPAYLRFLGVIGEQDGDLTA